MAKKKFNKKCVDVNIGAMLGTYMQDNLSYEETEIFTEHLSVCKKCFSVVNGMINENSFDDDDDDDLPKHLRIIDKRNGETVIMFKNNILGIIPSCKPVLVERTEDNEIDVRYRGKIYGVNGHETMESFNCKNYNEKNRVCNHCGGFYFYNSIDEIHEIVDKHTMCTIPLESVLGKIILNKANKIVIRESIVWSCDLANPDFKITEAEEDKKRFLDMFKDDQQNEQEQNKKPTIKKPRVKNGALSLIKLFYLNFTLRSRLHPLRLFSSWQ